MLAGSSEATDTGRRVPIEVPIARGRSPLWTRPEVVGLVFGMRRRAALRRPTGTALQHEARRCPNASIPSQSWQRFRHRVLHAILQAWSFGPGFTSAISLSRRRGIDQNGDEGLAAQGWLAAWPATSTPVLDRPPSITVRETMNTVVAVVVAVAGAVAIASRDWPKTLSEKGFSVVHWQQEKALLASAPLNFAGLGN